MQSRINKIKKFTTLGMQGFIIITVLLYLTMGMASFARADDKSKTAKIKKKEEDAMSNAAISETSVRAPLGRFLLLRRGKAHCALKFTSFNSTGSYEKGDWHHYAEYEWYYNEQKDGRFVGEEVRSGKDKLDAGSMKHFWYFVSTPGNYLIKCGDFKLAWVWPTGVPLEEGFSSKSNGIEVAPTRWEDINEVDFSEPSLIWYYFKDIYHTPKNELIPIEKLPPQK